MINEKYSFGDFLDKQFKDLPASDFNNTTIKGSCFYQQYFVDSDIFPTGMVGVTFENCNLDNVLIPNGNTIVGGCNKKIRVQNDGVDWLLDGALNPVEPVDKKRRLAASESIDPADIPATYILERVLTQEEFDSEFNNNSPKAHSWHKVMPVIKNTVVKTKRSVLRKTEFEVMKAVGKFGKFAATPTVVGNPTPDNVEIEGIVTYHTVEGECWKFKAKDGGFYG